MGKIAEVSGRLPCTITAADRIPALRDSSIVFITGYWEAAGDLQCIYNVEGDCRDGGCGSRPYLDAA